MTRHFVAALAAALPRRRGARPGPAAEDQRQAVLREARPERARLHERVQRLVLRREDGRHRAHPSRGANGHRRRRAPEPHARAVGFDPEARGSQGRRAGEHDRGDAALRGVRLRFARRGHAGRPRLPDRGGARQAGAGRARGPRRPQPRVPTLAVLGAHLPRGRPAGRLPALPGRSERAAPAREEDPPVRGLLDVRPPRPQGLRRGAADRRREDARDGARGSRALRHDPLALGRSAAPRRPQPRPERLVRRANAAGHEDHGQGGRVVRRSRTRSRAGPARPSSASRRWAITRRSRSEP